MKEMRTDEQELREYRFYAGKKTFLALVILMEFLFAIGVPLTKMGYEAFHIRERDIFQMITYAGVRLFFSGLLVLLYCVYKKIPIWPESRGEVKRLIELGLIMSVLQYIFLYVGTALSSGVVVSILCSSGSFLGILFSSLVFKEDKMTLRKIAGCILGLIAVIILNLKDLRAGMVLSVFGGFMIIAAQGTGTLGAIFLKYISQGKNAVRIGASQTFFGGALLLAIGMAGGGTLEIRGGDLAGALCPTLVLVAASTLALIISNQLYKYNDISKVVIFTLLLPMFGAVTSAILLHESLASATLLASLALSCIGVALVNIEPKDRP